MRADHREFGQVVRTALDTHAGPGAVRRVWSDTVERDRMWALLAELGVLAIAVPEPHGGVGGEPIDLALSLEEVGRHALPLPVVETVTATMALRMSRDDVAAAWLPSVADGRSRFSVVGDSGLAPHGASTQATLRLAPDGVDLFTAGDVEWSPVASTDPGLDLARWIGATVDGLALGVPAEQVRTTAAWTSALVLVGLAHRMVEMARDHALAREQFGRPIAEFQALKHRLADAIVAVEAARGLAWFAAYAAGRRPDELAQAARLAKGSASEAARVAGAAALQLHGGIGFTWEHDLHLFLHRARSLETWFGSAGAHRVAAGRALLDSLSEEMPHGR
nr:acyl-CoA dehydrogenase family protein [Nocardioides marinisabuli]